MRSVKLLIPITALALCACSQTGSSDDSEFFSSKRAIESSSKSESVSSSAPKQEQKAWESFDEFFTTLDENSMIVKNYQHNNEIWQQSGIQGQLIESGQDTPPQNELHLGKYRFGYNGCEVIAGYNMLTLLGEDVDMAKLIAEFEHNILVAQDGSFGSEPREMYLLLDKHGYTYETMKTTAECDKALNEGKSLIFSYYTGTPYFSEIHTICIIGGEEKYVLNRYNTVDDRQQITGISDITADDKNVIIAYVVKTQ